MKWQEAVGEGLQLPDFHGNFGPTHFPGLRENILCRWYDLVVCTPVSAAEHVNKYGGFVDAQQLIDGNHNARDRCLAQTGLRHPKLARKITNFSETSPRLSTALTGGLITIGDTILVFPANRAGWLALPFRQGLASELCYSRFGRADRRHASAGTSVLEWLSEFVRRPPTEVDAFPLKRGIDICPGCKGPTQRPIGARKFV